VWHVQLSTYFKVIQQSTCVCVKLNFLNVLILFVSNWISNMKKKKKKKNSKFSKSCSTTSLKIMKLPWHTHTYWGLSKDIKGASSIFLIFDFYWNSSGESISKFNNTYIASLNITTSLPCTPIHWGLSSGMKNIEPCDFGNLNMTNQKKSSLTIQTTMEFLANFRFNKSIIHNLPLDPCW
jgi:hypothetical protein